LLETWQVLSTNTEQAILGDGQCCICWGEGLSTYGHIRSAVMITHLDNTITNTNTSKSGWRDKKRQLMLVYSSCNFADSRRTDSAFPLVTVSQVERGSWKMGKTLSHKLLNTSSPGIAVKRTKIYRQSLLTVCQNRKGRIY
jgi:hypothetical protein